MGRFLVTGATGQIGSFVCEELASAGDEVAACDVRALPPSAARPSVSSVMVDITDKEGLLEATRHYKPDCMIHLAAVVLLDSIKDPALAFKVNIMGTNNVLEVARLLDVSKVVLASSVVVYGNAKTRKEGVADEDDSPSPPSDPYSTSKMASELMGRFYLERYGLDVNSMRIAAAWGPGRYVGYTGQFNDYVRKVVTGMEATFPEDFSYSKAKLRWLYVKDVAGAFIHAARRKRPRRHLYNTGSRRPFAVSDVKSTLATLFPGRDLRIVETEKPTAVSANVAGPNGLDVDCSRLYDELGFTAKYDLSAAVADMASFEHSKGQ